MTLDEKQFLDAVGNRRCGDAANGICEACVAVLGVQAAVISLVHDRSNVATLGASSLLAQTYDEIEFTIGEGPSRDAVARGAPVVVIDLADPDEVCWPLYRPAMLSQRIRGIVAMPVMMSGHCVGALTLFQNAPQRLNGDLLSGSLLAADLAQLPLLDLYDELNRCTATDPNSTDWNEQEHQFLTRREVDQATGMVMAQLDVGPDEALVRLRAHAYATDTSATQTARAIIGRQLRLNQS